MEISGKIKNLTGYKQFTYEGVLDIQYDPSLYFLLLWISRITANIFLVYVFTLELTAGTKQTFQIWGVGVEGGGDIVRNTDPYEKYADYIILFSASQYFFFQRSD